MAKSTISRQIKKLEESLNESLFEKRNNNFSLTPRGRRLFDQSHAAIHSLNIGIDERSEDSGILRLHTPSTIGRGLLAPHVADFMLRYKESSIEVRLTDRFTEPDPALFDISIMVGIQPGREYEVWPLGNVFARLYAAPKLFKHRAPPKTPAELKHWALLSSECDPGIRSVITLHQQRAKSSVMINTSRLVTAEPELLTIAATKGLGIARLPTFYAEAEIKEKKLIPILEDWWVDKHAVYLARPADSTNLLGTRFVELIRERINLV